MENSLKSLKSEIRESNLNKHSRNEFDQVNTSSEGNYYDLEQLNRLSKMYPTVFLPDLKINKGHLYFLTFITSTTTFYIGYNMGVFDTMEEHVAELFGWSSKVKLLYLTLITTLMPVGAALGAFLSGLMTNKYGRRKSLIYIDFIGMLGCIFTLFQNTLAIMAGRFFVGFALGGFTSVARVYMAEMSPIRVKGNTMAIIDVFEMFGVSIAYLTGLGLNNPKFGYSSYWWRFMFGLSLLTLTLHIACLYFVFDYDTPVYTYISNLKTRTYYETPAQMVSQGGSFKMLKSSFRSNKYAYDKNRVSINESKINKRVSIVRSDEDYAFGKLDSLGGYGLANSLGEKKVDPNMGNLLASPFSKKEENSINMNRKIFEGGDKTESAIRSKSRVNPVGPSTFKKQNQEFELDTPPTKEIHEHLYRSNYTKASPSMINKWKSVLNENKIMIVSKNNETAIEETRKVLRKFYLKEDDIEQVLCDIQDVAEEKLESSRLTYCDLFRKKYLKRTLIGIILGSSVILNGANALIYYSNSIFEEYNNHSRATVYTNLIGFAQLVGALISVSFVEHLGRKKILFIGYIAITINLIGIWFTYKQEMESVLIYLFLLYISLYAVTVSPVTNIYVSDILPEKGISLVYTFYFISTIILTSTFKVLREVEAIGITNVWLIYSGICLLTSIFVICFVKETHGKTLSELEKIF